MDTALPKMQCIKFVFLQKTNAQKKTKKKTKKNAQKKKQEQTNKQKKTTYAESLLMSTLTHIFFEK